jgi:hypothetical protein
MHDWIDENCLKLLNNCRRALPEKGKVLIDDFVVRHQMVECLKCLIW